jgi:hypothetical protein
VIEGGGSDKTPAVPETPEICVITDDPVNAMKKCQEVFATSTVVAGVVCVEVSKDASHLEVSFEATGNWTLITTEFWVGDNISNVPSNGDGVDTESFPYYWCNSTGESRHLSNVDLKWSYLCEDLSDFTLTVVAQVTLGEVDSEGQLIEGSELITFATEHQVSTADGTFGYFDVDILCECVPSENETRRLDVSTSDADPAETSPCNKDAVVAEEDFETGTASGWNNGLIALDERFGRFLGRLGRENRAMSKVFAVPSGVERLKVAFSVYATGVASWGSDDQFRVKVGIADINLGDFTQTSANGITQDITWSRRATAALNHYEVVLDIPREYFLGREVTLAFEAAIKDSIARKSAGVDNLVITAIGANPCDVGAAGGVRVDARDITKDASGFRVGSLTDFNVPDEGEEDTEDDEGRGYCHSEDFPCGDAEGMVYVCHYSITSGYQTFCMKESDSDLVRTYPDDYCGPCIGGYGSLNTQQKTAP